MDPCYCSDVSYRHHSCKLTRFIFRPRRPGVSLSAECAKVRHVLCTVQIHSVVSQYPSFSALAGHDGQRQMLQANGSIISRFQKGCTHHPELSLEMNKGAKVQSSCRNQLSQVVARILDGHLQQQSHRAGAAEADALIGLLQAMGGVGQDCNRLHPSFGYEIIHQRPCALPQRRRRLMSQDASTPLDVLCCVPDRGWRIALPGREFH